MIGAHSLSELDWTTFCAYFENVACKPPAVFCDAPLATERGSVERTLNLIAQRFKEDRRLLSERQVANILLTDQK